MKTRGDVHALPMFLLDYEMNDELLRLAHEVWSQKNLVPLKALETHELTLSLLFFLTAASPRASHNIGERNRDFVRVADVEDLLLSCGVGATSCRGRFMSLRGLAPFFPEQAGIH